MAGDNWTKRALIDDSIVAALLLRLKHHHSSPSLPPLRWGHRQLRSKPPSKDHCHPQTRCSPTTPLSWSAASVSDGCDNSAARSKGAIAYELGTATTSKKSRKKKTFTELKEEESYLLNERVHLEKELVSVHMSLKEQRSRGHNLKRIKLDSRGPSANEMPVLREEPVSTTFSQCHQTKASIDNQNYLISPRHATHNDTVSSNSCKLLKDFECQERGFILPDLNMVPSEEEPVCEFI